MGPVPWTRASKTARQLVHKMPGAWPESDDDKEFEDAKAESDNEFEDAEEYLNKDDGGTEGTKPNQTTTTNAVTNDEQQEK